MSRAIWIKSIRLGHRLKSYWLNECMNWNHEKREEMLREWMSL